MLASEPTTASVPRSTKNRAPGVPRSNDQDLTWLFERWQRDRDSAARDALVARFMPLARKLARRYIRSSEPFDDLLQVASLGLVNAIDRFDPERGSRFAAFAVPTILGELRRHFRDAAWAVHVPRGAQERALAVDDTREHLTVARGSAPSVTEIAEYMELTLEEVVSALQCVQAYTAVSLDAPRRMGDDDHAAYGETIGLEDERFELIEDDIAVSAALKSLHKRERWILHLRFVEDLTQTQIAERVGLSQMQVSRLLRQSLDKLRELTTSDPGEASSAVGGEHDPDE
jgi:RNA polymerase sigma-B factor